MYLRKLREKDAHSMLEWMHDSDVVEELAADFMNMTLDDCLEFIRRANEEESRNLHRAICNEEDEYLGTVSLKNISQADSNAEYAIVVSGKAMGSGASMYATKEILRIAFEELKLHKVYLYVRSGNGRALKFYDKVGFRKEGEFVDHIRNRAGNYENLIWLALLNQEFCKAER